MTQDEIIEMAREAEFDLTPTPNMLYTVRGNYAQLNCLINLVAAKEREACAKVCDDDINGFEGAFYLANKIRARGEA